jgi:hypothetical protein
MKYIMCVLLISLWAPISKAQSETDRQIDNEFAIVDVDGAQAEAQEAREFARQEKQHKAEIKADAIRSMKEAKSLEGKAAKQAAKLHKEGEIAQAEAKKFKRQLMDSVMKKAYAEKKIAANEKKIAATKKRREDLRKQKVEAEKKAFVLVQKQKASEKALHQANASVTAAATEARVAKAKLKATERQYAQAQRIHARKMKIARLHQEKYKTEIKKSKLAQRKLDRGIASLAEE